jgi:Nif-specific regulatory protein
MRLPPGGFMRAGIHFDNAPIAADEVTISNLDNELLTTLVEFAWNIRDHRRDPIAIRERVLQYVLDRTPAARVAIVPAAAAESAFEPVYRTRSGSGSIHLKKAVVDQVSEWSRPVMSPSVICLPMRAFQSRQGVLYAQIAHGSAAFDRRHLERLTGVAAVAAIAIEHAAQVQALEERNRLLQQDEDARYHLVGDSAAMVALKTLIGQTAQSDSTAFILGESGTGKELVARAIHRNSKRSSGPFVAVNCGAIPEGTAESELFGHERGAFTGAMAQRKGKFEQAQGGTIFLDEVGELTMSLQVKLLRVLQEREAERVGGNKPVKLDIRIVAATNRDVERAVATGKLREDLYYRLKVVTISVPPLRERRDDIFDLARHFVSRYVAETGRRICTLSSACEKMLEHHDWPGNVRELQNVIERAIVMSPTGILLPSDFPPYLHLAGAAGSRSRLKELSNTLTREALEAAMIKSGGDCAAAGVTLRKSQATVYREVKRLGLTHLLKRPRTASAAAASASGQVTKRSGKV